ncbi:MAG: hypothetical protein M1357_02910, partial [Candidatus Marsarchaeota archaeon]|nr:hypothetical protein [Candidatus Marsarchaeota archaeon]
GADSVHGGSVSNASRPSESIRAQECLITHVTDSVENEELDPDRLMDYIERALEPNPTGNGLRQN